jgi:hypothetical protein
MRQTEALIASGTRLDKERKEAEIKKRERDEQHLYLTAKVDSRLCLHSRADH